MGWGWGGVGEEAVVGLSLMYVKAIPNIMQGSGCCTISQLSWVPSFDLTRCLHAVAEVCKVMLTWSSAVGGTGLVLQAVGSQQQDKDDK